MTLITILGGSGFIGSHIVQSLGQSDLDYLAPGREENLSGRDLGTIIYCIGLTADFRSRPLDTVSAHVGRLLEVIKDCQFKSLIYLSSTRLYQPNSTSTHEEDPLTMTPSNPSDLYNISKAMGESLALTTSKSTVVRLSNVYGPELTSQNFLSSIIRSGLEEGEISFATSLDSEKDYIDVGSVVDVLLRMATNGCRERIYNVATGRNFSNEEIANRIALLTGCRIKVRPDAPRISYPKINVSRVKAEFNFSSRNVLEDMEDLINFYRSVSSSINDLN